MTGTRLAPLRYLTVLLAEDDNAMRESLARTLGLYFGEVLSAPNGICALSLFKKNRVDMAVLDIAMPGTSGLDVSAAIREEDPDLPVIILTCHNDATYMQTAVRLRLMAYLLKPVDVDVLEGTLAGCLEEMQQRGRLDVRLTGGARFNPITGAASRDNRAIELTRNERRFLAFMLKRRGVMVEPYQICRELEPEGEFSLNALRNLVYRLRAKIGRDAVVCNKDIGYTLP